jgi:hypothetical protein
LGCDSREGKIIPGYGNYFFNKKLANISLLNRLPIAMTGSYGQYLINFNK